MNGPPSREAKDLGQSLLQSRATSTGTTASEWLGRMNSMSGSSSESRPQSHGTISTYLRRASSVRSGHDQMTTARKLSQGSFGAQRGSSRSSKMEDPEKGYEFGPPERHFCLKSAVAFGGSSTVYEAEHWNRSTKLNGVAVKVIYPENMASCDAKQELDIWKELPHHPHLLQLIHYEKRILDDPAENTNNTRHYLVMQFSRSGNLLRFVRQEGKKEETMSNKGPQQVMSLTSGTSTRASLSANKSKGISIRAARDIMRQLASAIYCLHKVAHVVHNDLKLENVLGFEPEDDQDGPITWKIADFGLSQKVRTDSYLGANSAPTPCGTVAYVAPELISYMDLEPYLEDSVPSHNRPSLPPDMPVFARDMWALGCILYALLAGQLPFMDGIQSRMIRRISNGDYEMPYRLLSDSERENRQGEPNWNNNDNEPEGSRSEARQVLEHLLDTNPRTRWTIDDLCQSRWLSLY
ncbi:protein kinase [Malassezia pachydermatis]